MKIASISARAVDCGFQKQALQTSRIASPMSQFPRFAAHRASWMWPTKKVFVRIESTDGVVGWSCTNCGEVVALIINGHLAGLLQGESFDDIDDLNKQLINALLPFDRSGFAMMAVAGIDIALWDLQAKTQGKALVDLLGGAKADSLRTYATTPQPEAHTGKPWHGMKAAAPYGPESGKEGLAENVALMRRFKEAAGPDVPIMIDAFLAWDVEYTLRFAEATADLGLLWIEDPIAPQDIEGLQRLRREMDPSIALALGNFAFSAADCADLMRSGVVGVLQPDVAWAGGISEMLPVMDHAAQSGTQVILHNTCEQPWALAMAAAKQVDPLVEFVDRGDASPLYSLSGAQAVITDGRVAVPTSPDGNTPPEYALAAFEAAQHTNKGD